MVFPTFTVFDTETTGLNPQRGDRIIEIAALRIENGKICEEDIFAELVNPEREIPWEAKKVNKIEDEEVKNAPTIDQVLPRFLEFSKGSILVAQNAQFDMGFLTEEKKLCWGYIELPECICTMRLSRSLYPQDFRHNLDAIATRFGLEMPQNRHRALPDVILTAQALIRMIEEGNISNIDELRKISGIEVTA